MSDDCQKTVMLEQDSDFGLGRCEVKAQGSKHRAQDRTCRYCSYNAEPGGCGESKGSDDTCEYFSK
jgi:hypothetical protein